jgi:hypothetical protein
MQFLRLNSALTNSINHVVFEGRTATTTQYKGGCNIFKRVVGNVAAAGKVIEIDSLEGRA